MKDKMDRPKNDELLTEQKVSTGHESSGVDSSRRRIFGAGVAAPIILSMSSRTAWGGALCAPSAFNSATFASHHPGDPACSALAGARPSTWAASPGAWPAAYVADSSIGAPTSDSEQQTACQVQATTAGYAYAGYYVDASSTVYCRGPQTQSFNAIFSVNTLPPETSLLEVLLTKPNSSIESHAVAALLNAASGKITLGLVSGGTSVVERKVIDIFRALMNGSGYTLPETGQVVFWDTDPNGVGLTMQGYFDTYAE
ncbi:hypothetical protein [Neptunomonas japonica]|nr:hypothetical protein [Neptunomonas japonica]